MSAVLGPELLAALLLTLLCAGPLVMLALLALRWRR